VSRPARCSRWIDLDLDLDLDGKGVVVHDGETGIALRIVPRRPPERGEAGGRGGGDGCPP
jgi:hypothetical protein